MRNLMFLFILLTITACSDANPQTTVGVNLEVSNYIILKNSQGQNLLEPSTLGHYTNNEIYVFKLDPNGHEIVLQRELVKSEPSSPLYLDIWASNPGKSFPNESTVFLRLSKTEIDTIKTQTETVFGNSSSSTYVTKLWYNGELKWSRELDNGKTIEIIKK